jgi:hypothetical protein
MADQLDLRGLSENGFVRFSIKARDTPENIAVHDAFREFARVECDNDFTIALRALLKNYSIDYRFEVMWEHINSLREEVNALHVKPAPKTDKEEERLF